MLGAGKPDIDLHVVNPFPSLLLLHLPYSVRGRDARATRCAVLDAAAAAAAPAMPFS